MIYSNDSVRRKDRLLEEKDALHLLRTGEYGFLSMQAEGGGAYGVLVNFVWNGRDSVYFHCAPEGRKLRCLDRFTAQRLSDWILAVGQGSAREFAERNAGLPVNSLNASHLLNILT